MITFGPEWIRSLSSDGSSSTNLTSNASSTSRSNIQHFNSHSSVAAAPRFADHRYGREEMLSLYEREIHAPQELQDFGNIFVRRKQPPLALTDNSEEDNGRHWQRQNSNPVGIVPPPVGPIGLRGGESIIHAPRGRGRQRQFHVPGQNSITYHNSRFAGRGEESQTAYSDSGRSFYSSWNDRGNAGFDSSGGEWVNQRRDFTSQPPHTNRWSDWRRPGVARLNHQDDSEDARRANAPMDVTATSFRHRAPVGPGQANPNRYSWRGKEDHDKNRYDRERGFTGERDWGDRNLRERGAPRTLRRGWSGDGNDENALPEWAVETTNSEANGSFDSSGAFHAPAKPGCGGDEPLQTLHPLTHSHSHSSFMTNKNNSIDQQPSGNNNSGLSRSLTQANINVPKSVSKKHVSFAKDEQKVEERRSESPTRSTGSAKVSTVNNNNKQFDVTKINFKKVSPTEKNTSVSSSTNLDWWSPDAMFVNDNSTENKPVCDSSVKDGNSDHSEKLMENGKREKISDGNRTNSVMEHIKNESGINKVNQLPPPQISSRREKYDVKHKKVEQVEINQCDKEDRIHSECQKKFENVQHGPMRYDFNDESDIKSVLLTSTDKSLREQHQNFIQPTKEPVTLPDLSRPPPQPPQQKLPLNNLKQQSNMGYHDKPISSSEQFCRPYPEMDKRTYESMRNSHHLQNEPIRILSDHELFDRNTLNAPMESQFKFVEENPVISKPQEAKIQQSQQPVSIFQQPQVSHSPAAPPASGNLWYYKDPQGEVQGPFEASHMAEWYNSGFFKTDLLVRRDCDFYLYPLGSLGPTPPFLQSESTAAPPPTNTKAISTNFNRTFAAMPNLLNKLPTSQDLPIYPESRNLHLDKMVGNDDFYISQQQRQSGVMNVTPMAEQQQILYYPTPSEQQVHPAMVQPPHVSKPLDSLAKTVVTSPVEQATISATSQPPLEESMSAFLRQQASSSWNNAPNEMPWAANLFQQQTPASLWDSKPFTNNQAGQLNLEMEVLPNASTPLVMSSLVSPAEKHQRMLAQLPSSLFEEKPIRPKNPDFMMWEGYELPEEKFKEKETWRNVPVHPFIENIPTMMDEYSRERQMTTDKEKTNPNKQMPQETFRSLKEDEERLYSMFPHCRTGPKDEQTESIPRNSTSVEQTVALQQTEDFTNLGFQKVPSKKEEKQLKMQKMKEAKKKADILKKGEEEQLAFMNNYKEPEEIVKCHQFEAQKIQEVQKQRTHNAKIAPWSAVTEVDRNGSKLSLSEIQRLEREKKLEQAREQEIVMQQMFAQQQRANQLREQEFSQGWTKISVPQKSLSEIQLEELHQTLKMNQQATAIKEMQTPQKQASSRAVTPQNQNPWSTNPGFWESLSPTSTQKLTPAVSKQTPTVPPPVKKVEKAAPPTSSASSASSNTPANNTTNKNAKARTTAKKTRTPTLSSQTSNRDSTSSCNPVEQKNFDEWCAEELKPWKDSIDIPTFVNFLKDVQSSLDVVDYIKSVTGETPEAALFIRQYLDIRYPLLRRGNDCAEDLSTMQSTKLNSNEFQEVKGKNKKVKKNKMLKVDARILGFSTTASEDRINVHK